MQPFGSQHAMRVWLDQEKLAGYGLSASEAPAAVQKQNSQTAGGGVVHPPITRTAEFAAKILTQNRFSTPEQFRPIIIRSNSDGSAVRLSDVARVALGSDDYTFKATLNGKEIADMAINTLSLFGMVVAIDILFDDAVVVVENAGRIVAEERLNPRRATLKTMKQITGAIIGIACARPLDDLPDAKCLLGEDGHDANWFGDSLQARGIEPCIPSRKSRNEPVRYDKRRYRRRRRRRIEIMVGRLRDWCRVATRYARCPTAVFSTVALAATVIFWL